MAFEALRVKLAETPMLKHFDPHREPIVIVYASEWAVVAVLAQVHDGVCMPVKFTSRMLRPNELNYSMAEKEILALLRALNNGFTMLAGRTIRVLTIHTTLAWLFRWKGLQGRLSQWTAVLSPWPRTSWDGGPAMSCSTTGGIEMRVPICWPIKLYSDKRDESSLTQEEIQGLVTLNRLKEIVRPTTWDASPDLQRSMSPQPNPKRTDSPVLPVVTRSAAAQTPPPRTHVPGALQELAVQRLRLDRVRVGQDEELWIANLKRYIRGDLGSLSRREAKDCRKLAPQYEEGESGLLYYRSKGDEAAEDRDTILKLVVPETLRDDTLHHYHASHEGVHQGIGRTYQRVI
ncbi:unnamed protein product [Phytophthora fragariaefolia]|uniref:Unnamed protein product n=1 Tax=Phytophthora fragariaefolia TaxID=1490495 RepID=A0A9W6Y2S0_9STRA|nr:unnamed protein product [Phytophthora fragariaefolia]